VDQAVESRSQDWEPAKRAMQEHLASACDLIARGLDANVEEASAAPGALERAR
jgi:hypothetical protein